MMYMNRMFVKFVIRVRCITIIPTVPNTTPISVDIPIKSIQKKKKRLCLMMGKSGADLNK